LRASTQVSLSNGKFKFVKPAEDALPSVPPIVPVEMKLDDPRKEEDPIIVEMMLNVMDVSEVNEAAFTATVDIEMVYFWTDTRLIGKKQEKINWEETWKPCPTVANSFDRAQDAHEDPDVVLQDSSTGFCKATRIFRGHVRNRLDLMDFPFDWNTVEVHVDFQQQGLPIEQVQLRLPTMCGPVAQAHVGLSMTGILNLRQENSALAAWMVLSYGLEERIIKLNQSFTRISFTLSVQRYPTFFIGKIASLLVMSTSLSFLALLVSSVADRLSILTTVFLADGALLFVANDAMPKLGYLTAADQFIISNFAIVFLLSITCALSPVLVCGDDEDGCEDLGRVDAIAASVLGFAFVVSTVVTLGLPWRQHVLRRRTTSQTPDWLDSEYSFLWPGEPNEQFGRIYLPASL